MISTGAFYTESCFFIAMFSSRRSKYQKAVDAAKNALSLTPNKAELYLTLGEAFYKLEEYDNAVETLLQAIHLNPHDASAHYLLGRAYINLGREEEGFEAFRSAIKLDQRYAIEFSAFATRFIV